MPIPSALKKLTPVAWLWILFLTGLTLRVAVSVFFGDNRTVYFEHMLIARNLLEGKGYVWDEWGRVALQPSSLIPPLYVYWCWFFQWISSQNFLPMYIAQALIAATGCFPAFRVGRRLFSDQVGLVFAALYAFYPEFVFLHSKAVAESLYVVFILWMIERYLALSDALPGSRDAIRKAVIVGVLSGIAMLVKEAAAIVALSILIALVIHFRRQRSAMRSHILPLIAAAAIVLAPWMIRNFIVQREFVPLRTGYGINFWISNHPGSAGNDRYSDGVGVFSRLPESNPAYWEYINRILPFDEQDRDWVYGAETIRFIRERPGEYLSLCALRLSYWVWFVSNHQLASNPIYRASWILLLLLSLPGAVIAVRQRRMDAVLPLILLGYMLLYIPSLVLPRYRIVTVLLLLLFAAVAIEHWRVFMKTRRANTRGIPA
ncbi:hypothetical protein EHM69_10870 [candidate division KSB1 bacterium]|nr:MAG: hypothetical protein EHM69_10870 [candidate division KSB1 bacterium]